METDCAFQENAEFLAGVKPCSKIRVSGQTRTTVPLSAGKITAPTPQGLPHSAEAGNAGYGTCAGIGRLQVE